MACSAVSAGSARTVATNVAFLPVPPERVWAVLADPKTYGYWVVGTDTIRDADEHWPAVGSKLHHRVGIGPFKLNDNSEVLESDPPRRLVLQARGRPFGTARVKLELTEHDGGTRVTMSEGPGDPISRLFHNPLFDRLVRARNHESLRRLAELAGAGDDAPRRGVGSATP
jgi:uncharacterized protein YndB with AHSA1/START domain